MKVRIFFLFAFILLTACNSKPKPPKDVLPREKMIEVLVDFQLVEAAVFQQQNYQKDVKFYTNYYYDSVLKKHKISRKQFTTSINWYKNNMQEMDDMYGEILSRLSKMQVITKK